MTESGTPELSGQQIGADDIERITSHVPGWLSAVEGRLLHDLARRAPADGCILEIGSWQGRSTIWLAAGARSGRSAPVVAVDPHRESRLHADGEDTELALRSNLDSAGLSDQVEVVVATSRDAAEGWTRPISLLWIDGDHAYESVKEDFLLWEKHVVDGGVVALHDTLYWDGPARVVSEFLQRLRTYSDLNFVDTITYATKRRAPTLGQVLRKKKAVLHRHVYAIRAGAAPDTFHLAELLDGVDRLRRIDVTLRRRSADR
jgi:predicted O-methyltransferase YrrM